MFNSPRLHHYTEVNQLLTGARLALKCHSRPCFPSRKTAERQHWQERVMPLYRCTLIDEAVKAEMSEWRKGSVEVEADDQEAARQRAWSENWISRQKKPAPADFVPCDATIRVEKLD